MKNKWHLLCTMLILSLVLAACSSTDTEPVETHEPDITDIDSELEQDTDDNASKEIPEEDVAADRAAEEQVTDEDPSTALPDGAKLVNSDEQNFSLYLLPNYQLTSEEPGKDIVYSETDDAVFMRIETVPKEDGTYDFLAANVKELIALSDIKPVELTDDHTLPSGGGIENVQAYTVNFEEGPVTYLLFEKGNAIVRLTIFDSAEAKYFNDFLQMGETITVQ